MGNKRAAAAAVKGSKHKNQDLPAKEDTSVIHLDDVDNESEDSDWKTMHSAKAIVIVKEAAVVVKEVTNGSAQSGDEKMDTEAEAESPVVADAEDAKTSEGQHLVDISEAKTNGYDQLERELDLNGDSMTIVSIVLIVRSWRVMTPKNRALRSPTEVSTEVSPKMTRKKTQKIH